LRLCVLGLRFFGCEAILFGSYVDYQRFRETCCLSLHSSTLKVVAGSSSETLLATYKSARRSKVVVKFRTTKHDVFISLCSHLHGQCNVICQC
jgi:hypothetical protein